MDKKRYFDKPTQVCFWENEQENWCAGIAYRDEIICGCCGAIIEIADLYDEAPAEIGDPIREFDWVNITEEIVGDDWPFNPFEDAIDYEQYHFENLSDNED